jgi:hypothetical protein
VVQSELLQSRVLRAIYSQRQLQEVMTDFWLNHFNIFQGKTGEEIYSLVSTRIEPWTSSLPGRRLLFGSPDFQRR